MTISIRFASIEDAPQILDIYSPIVQSTPISFETEQPSLVEIQHRIETKKPWLVCDIDGIVAGYVYSTKYRERAAYQWSVEVSAYVHPDYRKCHIGKALYTSLFMLLKHHGYLNAYAGVALPNPASVGLHEAMGFKPIGVYTNVGYKLGQWHDVGWWHLALSEPPQKPVAPVHDIPAELIEAAFKTGLSLIKTEIPI